MIVVIIVAFTACGLLVDYRKNMRGAKPWEKILYLSLAFIGAAALLARELGVRIPSPAPPIVEAIKSVTGEL